MKLGLLCLFLTSTLYAGSVEWNGQIIKYDDRWSLKDFSTKTMLQDVIPPGTTIYATSFQRETPDSIVFPPVQNLTLIEVNVDNVLIPPSITVKNTYRKPPIKFKVQNDLRDWQVNDVLLPIKVLNEEYWIEKGFSVSPLDIPLVPLTSIEQIVKVSTVIVTPPNIESPIIP